MITVYYRNLETVNSWKQEQRQQQQQQDEDEDHSIGFSSFDFFFLILFEVIRGAKSHPLNIFRSEISIQFFDTTFVEHKFKFLIFT